MNRQPDQQIARTLRSLRDTQTPAGLNARIAARLAQAADANPDSTPYFASLRNPSLFASAPVYATAAVALAILLAASLMQLRHRNESQTAAESNAPGLTAHDSHPPTPTLATAQAHQDLSPAKTQAPQGSILGNGEAPQNFSPGNGEAPQNVGFSENQVPQGFSLGSHRVSATGGVLTPPATDLDALALTETLAPSHPAPPMPLTAEEHLLVLATRQGQPMELAELETLRQPALQAAAEAREQATLRIYVHSLLAPLAAAEAINPTSPSEDASTSQPPSR
jgi:hypothetical protein